MLLEEQLCSHSGRLLTMAYVFSGVSLFALVVPTITQEASYGFGFTGCVSTSKRFLYCGITGLAYVGLTQRTPPSDYVESTQYYSRTVTVIREHV